MTERASHVRFRAVMRTSSVGQRPHRAHDRRIDGLAMSRREDDPRKVIGATLVGIFQRLIWRNASTAAARNSVIKMEDRSHGMES